MAFPLGTSGVLKCCLQPLRRHLLGAQFPILSLAQPYFMLLGNYLNLNCEMFLLLSPKIAPAAAKHATFLPKPSVCTP